MMTKLKLFIIFLILFETIICISGTTHWVVTENGKIQSQLDSAFQMKRPYDLPGFLEQEKRMNIVQALHKKIMARKMILDSQIAVLNSIGDLESWLQSSNPECISNRKLLEDFDFYASVATDGSYRKGVTQKDYLLDGIPDDGKRTVPDCKKTFPLDFSMYTFEHLSAMRNRKNLTQHQEKGLIKYLPPGTDLNKFGHQIAHGLKRNNTSWLHLNLAAIYWRVKGDAYNALECARRAIVTAPREYRDIPLLTTGGILHAAKYSAEAAIVLHAAIDYAPTQSHQHLALGHVYAILGDYNRSLACYDNSLRLTPTMEQAKQAKFVILCCQSLTEALTALHKRLDDIVTDLHAQQKDYTEWLKLEEKILCERMKTPFAAFRAHRLGPILSHRGQSCMQREGDDAILSCQVTNDNQMFAHNLLVDIGVSLQQLKNVENQVEKINDRMSTAKVLPSKNEKFSEIQKNSNVRSTEFFTVFMEPTSKPKYYNFEIKKSNREFENKNWPDQSECEKSGLLIDTKQYVPIYLSPENKGYIVNIFVNELIGMDSEKEHMLPWYPPICQSPESFDSKFISPLLLKATTGVSSSDSSLTSFLTDLAKNSELAEIGQRILTATKSKVAAPWVLSMLASLHWRVAGKPRNALDCLQSALNTVPNGFKDVPLVSIASISQKFGLIDDALRATKEALRVNSIEPLTNYLYGSLLFAKKNYTGAVYHLKQSLRVDSELMDGKTLMLLRTVICYKRSNNRRTVNAGNEIESCGMTYPSAERIAKHDLNEGETVLCFGDGKDCKPIQCFAMKMHNDEVRGP
ncbi:tetratricopeptide repeat protein 17 isoform X1 [Microplitis mediator]|uniref:tetratricopeptide repeat protein 17 isoform X1 n=1 Tax=Microplitis mediator TaxID=375433 RepID=UPI0025575EC7|nr:tetratricopeptide repeat protein 17 isoform X1 [Microplitis mediator]XP_057331403.1 tetratricopeptide repeat protein 17 isoform X1 [Microplitis mediator]XP_057331404.1 tetratricopeptide repeat protein 17 isoform X1 [Microplitis mediator]